MEITPSDVEKFQSIYNDKFEIDLDFETAKVKLTALVKQLTVLTEVITDEHQLAFDVVLKNENEDINRGKQKTE